MGSCRDINQRAQGRRNTRDKECEALIKILRKVHFVACVIANWSKDIILGAMDRPWGNDD